MRVSVRKEVDAMISVDHSGLAASISRQPGVACRIDVAGANALAHFEERPYRRIAARRYAASVKVTRNSQSRRSFRRTARGFAILHFRFCDETILHTLRFKPC